jgi:hypothetical protein
MPSGTVASPCHQDTVTLGLEPRVQGKRSNGHPGPRLALADARLAGVTALVVGRVSDLYSGAEISPTTSGFAVPFGRSTTPPPAFGASTPMALKAVVWATSTSGAPGGGA